MTDPSNKPKLDPRPLLERPDLKPDERKRIGRAIVPLLGLVLTATSVLALLALWHLVRRGRMLRSNLSDPKIVRLPEPASDLDTDRDPGT